MLTSLGLRFANFLRRLAVKRATKARNLTRLADRIEARILRLNDAIW